MSTTPGNIWRSIKIALISIFNEFSLILGDLHEFFDE